MKRSYRYIIPAVLAAVIVATGCEGQKKTADISTTMQADRTALAGKNWKLETLMGEPVVSRNAAGEPFVNFGVDTNRVTGNTGCNSFFGTYNLPAPGKISFGKLGSTKRACPNMDVEMKYMDALSHAANYKLEGEVLLLSNADNKELAKFRHRAP